VIRYKFEKRQIVKEKTAKSL